MRSKCDGRKVSTNRPLTEYQQRAIDAIFGDVECSVCNSIMYYVRHGEYGHILKCINDECDMFGELMLIERV